MTARLQATFETILARYVEGCTTEPFGKTGRAWWDFSTAASTIAATPEVAAFRSVDIRWSVGQGRWAAIPWIAALDYRVTTRTSEGIYVIYLFRADMTGVYLTLNQGTLSVMARGGGLAKLRIRTAGLRAKSLSLAASGFVVGPGIDLRSSGRSAAPYETAAVAHKFYKRGSVPGDAALIDDLAAALTAYGALVR